MAMPTEDPKRGEEPDFSDEDERAMDAVWARIHRGESLDEILAEGDDEENGGYEMPDDMDDTDDSLADDEE